MDELESKRQPLEEAIYDYRKKHPGPLPDYDAKFILDILHNANDSSKIRIAINPVVDGLWVKDAKFFGITGCYVSDDHKLIFKVHRDKKTFTADELTERINKAMKSRPYKHIPVGFEYNDEIHKLTDMFGHSLVNEMWAGLPFDIILAETTPDVSKVAVTAPAEEG